MYKTATKQQGRQPVAFREVEFGGRGRVDFMFLSSYCGRVRHFTRSNDCVERILKDFSCNKLVFFPNHKPLSMYIWF